MAEEDLLNSDNAYELKNTGQGINRVQTAPSVARIMRELIHNMQTKTEFGWVGSSVVHLGDHNVSHCMTGWRLGFMFFILPFFTLHRPHESQVPNAYLFIEKYTQVSRILTPITCCLERIEELMKNDDINSFVTKKWGGARQAQREILVDFFRHGFDGSGADNFYDAGSCVDGRLTSSWNW